MPCCFLGLSAQGVTQDAIVVVIVVIVVVGIVVKVVKVGHLHRIPGAFWIGFRGHLDRIPGSLG